MAKETKQRLIYRGNSMISIEKIEEHPHPVVIKKPYQPHPSARILRFLEKEYEMTHALNGVAGVRKALGQQSIKGQPALILEYIDGETLWEHIRRNTFNLREKLEIAADLTRILKEIHQQDIIHLDLNSKNILIGNKDLAVHLIDLGSAARTAGNGHQKVRPDQMLGNLPYISPELTGRINRAVDERSDLYSLGVVFYELMTGQLPFDSKNAMELIHHHIARVPVSPTEVSSQIPEVISSIILKLLLKNAEDRYQSAAGVQADLETCLQRLKPDHTIERFALGAADYTNRFQFPQKLYGRDSELQELVRVFESACRETSAIIFVSGYSGIGKTALAEEMQRPVSEKQGYFIKGKFDQFRRTTPYTAITQAFAVFVSRILTEPEKNFNEWQEKIQATVGDLGQVLTEVIPALKDLIGTQPDVPQLGGQEAENRFNYLFINFLLAVATEKHPLVLFIDDLQWIDAASLRLLKVIRSAFNQSGLLIIGAYRDNEVEASHPLMGFVSEQEKAGKPPRILKLANLRPQHLEALLSDTLRFPKDINALATVIYEKAQGNPFFSRRLLFSLYEESRIRYDAEINSWKWDIEDINTEGIADNVADLVAKKIAQLPEEIQNILKLAACIGNRFDIATLAMISGLAEKEILKTLTVSLSGQYVFESNDTFEFVHDQVQQGGYALIAEEDRPQAHLQIGRLLLSNTPSEKVAESIFNIVHHFNVGAVLLKSESERITVAELNLNAGQKARSAAAYAEGFGYIEHGLALLGPDSWQDDYDLTLALHNEAAELAYLTGHYDQLDDIEGRVHENARSILDRARVYYIRIQADTDRGTYLEAIEIGIRALAELGIKIPSEPTPEDYQRYQAEFSEALAGRAIEGLGHLPAMTDRAALAAMEILASNFLNARIAAPQFASPLAYQGATLSLQNGNGPWSAYFYGCVGLQMCGAVDVAPSDESAAAGKTAYQLQKVAIDLLENPNATRSKAKTLNAAGHIQLWNEPIKNTLVTVLKAHEVSLETGDLVAAAISIYYYTRFGLAAGMNLGEFQRKVSTLIQGVKAIGQETMYPGITIGLQTAHNFMTPGSTPHVLKGQYFDEDQWLPDGLATNDRTALNYLFLQKLCLSFHFDCDDRLIEYGGEAEKYLAGVTGVINTALFRFYDSLSRLRLYDNFTEDERRQTLKRVASNQSRMRIWSKNAPMNFKHKYDLVAAETARVSGNIGPAMENYEQAIKGAGDNGFIHEEALANELYARFRQNRGNDRIAEMYMREARALYHQWGAGAKVSHLENRYPQWFKTQTIPSGQPDTPGGAGKALTTITQPITSIQMDLDSIVSASQTLSAETDLEQLLSRMMNLVMANSGAEKAVLLLRQGNDWFVQARSDVTALEHEIMLNRPYDPADSDHEGLMVPERVFHYCRRSKEVLVVGDAQLDQRFAQDRLVQKHGLKSIACIPALNQGAIRAMLYLENRQMPDVFTRERVKILQHLSSQFGVSVENALLYDSLSQAEAKYRTVANFTYDWEHWAKVDGTMEYISPSCKRISGYTVRNFQDNPSLFREIIVPQDREMWDRHYRDSRQELKPREITFRIKKRDGQICWIEHICQPVTDDQGRLQGLRASNRDVTARKQIEEGLQQSKEFNQSVLMSLSDHIAVLDRAGRILAVNEAWIRFARENDVTAADCAGPGVNYLEICRKASESEFGDETARAAGEGIRCVLDGSRRIFQLEYRCNSPTEKRWFLMNVLPFQGQKGGVIVSHTNITSRKLSELGLQEAYSEIEILKNQLEAESVYLRQEIKLKHNYENIVGQSDALKEILIKVEQVAPTDLAVLLLGETGTGKELISRAIHGLSRRKNRAMVKINCAALPPTLVESELFGHEKGAYTGALTRIAGRFEIADGGTLFLDEIGEMPLEMQAKLLRVVEHGEFERLGGRDTIKVDVRLIAATNQDLAQKIKVGQFREDLYYRLNGFPIRAPLLRQRPNDIPLLVWAFVREFEKKLPGKKIERIPQKTMQALQKYRWPGNVRELRNLIENAMVTSTGKTLIITLPRTAEPLIGQVLELEEAEHAHILSVLEKTGWRVDGQGGAAQLLGLKRTTLNSKMKKLGIQRPAN